MKNNGEDLPMELIPFSFAGLTPQWARAAEEELGETPEKKSGALRDFRKLISEQKDLRCRPDDIFLLRFLRMKKYNLDDALRVCRTYYAFKAKFRGVYTGFKPSELQDVLDMNVISFGPYRLPWGTHLGIVRLGNFDYRQATFRQLIAAVLVMGEMTLDCEATQLFGGTFVLDLKGLSLFDYLQYLSLSLISIVISIIQDCWPGKVKSIHAINVPLFARSVYSLVRPVMKKKIRDRFFLHGSNLESFHQHIPKEYLTEEFGGTLGPFDYQKFKEYYLGMESYIEMLDSYGLVDGTNTGTEHKTHVTTESETENKSIH